jgi:hypothetical protein
VPYVGFVAAADSRRGQHLPLLTVTIQSNIQRAFSPISRKPLNNNGFNKHEPNGTTFALIFLKASRVKALGRFR